MFSLLISDIILSLLALFYIVFLCIKLDTIIFILCKRFQEVEKLAQSHIASRWKNLISNFLLLTITSSSPGKVFVFQDIVSMRHSQTNK